MPTDDELLEGEEELEEDEEELEDEEEAEEEPEEGEEEAEDEEEPEGDEPGQAGKGDKPVPSSKVSKIVARENRKVAQKYQQKLDSYHLDLAEEAGVPPVKDRQELAEAVRLWKYLEHNPEVAAAVRSVLHTSPGKMPTYEGRRGSSEGSSGSAIELKLATMDLRARDKLFRKFENDVLDWADFKGVPVKDEKSLNLAYQAWKGANIHLLTAKAEAKGAKKALEGRNKAKAAGMVPRKGGAKTGKPDYRKMSDTDVLKSLGLKLETED